MLHIFFLMPQAAGSKEKRKSPEALENHGSNYHQEELKDHAEEQKTKIESSKNVTQVTNTLSMFVVHIGLLRAVMENHNTTYFVPQVTLITIALVLQVWTGVLSLYISWLTSHYNNYDHDLASDYYRTLCPCKIEKRGFRQGLDHWIEHGIEARHNRRCCSCCSCSCNSRTLSSREEDTLTAHKMMTMKLLKLQLQSCGTDGEEDGEVRATEEQLKSLTEYTEKIQKHSILRRIAVVQYLLSALVFCITILNAFFTGLGFDEIVLRENDKMESVSPSITTTTTAE